MKKFLKWIIGPLAFGLAFVAFKQGTQWVRDNEPGITTGRTAFMESAVRTCLQNQIAHPDNKGVSAAILSEYCGCFAKGMADRLTNNEMKAHAESDPEVIRSALQAKSEAAAQPCQEAAAAAIMAVR